jgi:hypothetical protein
MPVHRIEPQLHRLVETYRTRCERTAAQPLLAYRTPAVCLAATFFPRPALAAAWLAVGVLATFVLLGALAPATALLPSLGGGREPASRRHRPCASKP